MRAGQVTAPGRFEIVERPLPVPGPGEVLLDVAAVGICGTDYHILEGTQPFLSYPRVIGHELSAHVAVAAEGWEAGTLVAVNPYVACGACRACLRGGPNRCQRIGVLGVHREGGLTARIAVPVRNLVAAPGLTDIQAAMVEFLAIGAHAVRRSGLAAQDRVLVTGLGPIGIGTALFARLAGAEVHVLDTSADRLAMAAARFGLTAAHLVGEPLREGALEDGFDVVFDATGSARAIEAGFALVAHGGTYVLVSVVQGPVAFDDPEFHKREMRLVGSRNALAEDFAQVMEAMRAGAIDTDALLTETLTLDAFAGRFAALARDRGTLVKAVVRP